MKISYDKTSKNFILTIVGLIAMILTTLTKIIPSTTIAGYSVFVGIAFFFIVEASEKASNAVSGLSFKSIVNDLRKPWVIPMILLPIVTAIAALVVGDLLFKGEFSNHVIGRSDSLLSFGNLPLLIFQVVIAALGEEIAWRGFFLGKSMKLFPFWLCAIASSIAFAAGHIAVGNFELVFYDVVTVFIDSIIYSLIYKRSENCLISTISHILGNATAIAAMSILK